MKKTQSLSDFELALENFDPMSLENKDNVELVPVTFWIPTEKKAAYDALQAKSNKKFCKLVKSLLIYSIDKAAAKIAS